MLHFYQGKKQILHPLLVLRTLTVWIWCPRLLATVICDAEWSLLWEYCIRTRIIFHNISSECNSTFVWDTDGCFVHIQLMGTNVRLPTKHWDFKISIKFWVLEQSQSTMLRRVCHMTISSVIIGVMNVCCQTSLTSATGSCPYCDCSWKFVCRPKNVKSTRSCKKTRISRQFVSILLTILQLKWWSSKQGVEALYNCSVSLFASRQDLSTIVFACPSMS